MGGTWSPLKLLSSKAVRAHPARTPTVSISFLHFKFLYIFFKFFYLFFSIFYLFFPLFTHWHVCISATHQQPCQLLIRWNKSRVQNEPMWHAIQTLLQLHKLGLTLLWGTGTVCPSTCMCRKRKSRDHMSSYDITIQWMAFTPISVKVTSSTCMCRKRRRTWTSAHPLQWGATTLKFENVYKWMRLSAFRN